MEDMVWSLSVSVRKWMRVVKEVARIEIVVHVAALALIGSTIDA